MRQFVIGRHIIKDDSPCYVVAELGNNHSGNLTTARLMIRAAAAAGADAVKFQKRDIETLYSPAMLAQPYDHENSFGKTYGQHRSAIEFHAEQLHHCQTEATEHGITCFATAFDEPSADLLMHLQMPAIKLASGSLTDDALLSHVGAFGVPVVLSTGGGTEAQIDHAIQRLTAKTSNVAVLHCTAAYPVRDYTELNLRCISTLRQRYPDLIIGWSGHVSGIAMPLVAYAVGARMLEMHITLNRASKGTDHAFSLEPAGLAKLCRDLKRAHASMGDGVKRAYLSESAPLAKMRRQMIGGRWQIGTAAEVHA